MSYHVRQGLVNGLRMAESDDEAQALVIHCEGRTFFPGMDITEFGKRNIPDAASIGEVIAAFEGAAKPVIAAVRGHAVGQGCELAGVCDMTIAADDAKLGEIQIRHGFGVPVLISPFLVGLKQAKELLMLGELLDAEEALRIGLVNRVVPAERLDEEVEAIARKLAALPAHTVRMNKALVNRTYELAGFREALAYRDDPAIAALAERATDDDVSEQSFDALREEGWGAFKQRRDAMYREED